MSVLFHQNGTLCVSTAGRGSGMAHARRPGMSVLFHQNRTLRIAQQDATAAWLMHGGRV